MANFPQKITIAIAASMVIIFLGLRSNAAGSMRTRSNDSNPSNPHFDHNTAGAGALNYGRPLDNGAIAPLTPIGALEKDQLKQKEGEINHWRFFGPLILQKEELDLLLPGRSGPSQSINSYAEGLFFNFANATSLINTFVSNHQEITIERINQINAVLLSTSGYSEESQAGLTRDKTQTHHYHGGITTDSIVHGAQDFGAAPDLVGLYLRDFINWYHHAEAIKMDPIEMAAAAYQQLVRIHPYKDANGRTTRLVMDWILQKYGLPPAIFVQGNSFEAIHTPTGELTIRTAEAVLAAQKRLLELPAFVVRFARNFFERDFPLNSNEAILLLGVTTHTELGQIVFVSGNIAELGNWDLRYAIPLYSRVGKIPQWATKIKAPKNKQIDFKFLRKNNDGTFTWEETQGKGNRRITLTAGPHTQFHIENEVSW